jgi:hypothetical protein
MWFRAYSRPVPLDTVKNNTMTEDLQRPTTAFIKRLVRLSDVNISEYPGFQSISSVENLPPLTDPTSIDAETEHVR